MNKLILIYVAVLISICLNAQTKPKLYLHLDSAWLTKNEILSIGKIIISDTNYIIDRFVYVFAGSTPEDNISPSFGVNYGAFFSEHFINEVKKRKPKITTFSFQDFHIHHKKNSKSSTIKLETRLAYVIK